MIHSHSVDVLLAKPFHDSRMCRNEHARAFDTDPNQGVDVEESSVSKLLVRGSPVGQSVILEIDVMHPGRPGRACSSFTAWQIASDVPLLSANTAQQLVEHRLVAMARRHHLIVGRFRRGSLARLSR